MLPAFPIGVDDFRFVREQGLRYVDKTRLIQELIDKAGTQVVLLPRPRRFGKTINLSMLRYYFERADEDRSWMFAGLNIWGAGEAYRSHFQRYPVIHLNFKGVKFGNFQLCWDSIRLKLANLFEVHRGVLDAGVLSEDEAARYRQVLSGKAEPALYHSALLDLSRYLHVQFGERVVVLIDEYDEPIHAGFLHGYSPQIIEFFRAFLTDGLKSRQGGSLDRFTRALLTGDAEELEVELQGFVTHLLSYHDVASINPEDVYHAFVVGLLAALEPAYQVRSNRESGLGRPDVLILPREAGQVGAVLELKVARRRKTLEQALTEGLEQIRTRDYGAALRAAGAGPIQVYAVAFDGKEVRVERGEPGPLTRT